MNVQNFVAHWAFFFSREGVFSISLARGAESF